MKAARDVLKRYWGYDAFRPLQEEIIQTVLNKKDVLALMPTGGGKSICFQVPALLQQGLTLVISPLIALMQDQVTQLKQRNIATEALYAGMKEDEISHVLDRCAQGKLTLLYLSPERLKTKLFLTRLPQMKVALLAVDEAHCISQWGYDFRPSYLEIALLKEKLPGVPTIALTATATGEVQTDICDKLAMKNALILKKSFSRPNLTYAVRNTEDKVTTLLHILNKVEGPAIVYVTTRAAAKQIAERLNRHNVVADYYHAGLDMQTRKTKQVAWIKEAIRVMVATNAFGMGIDKGNVRLVVHINPPTTLEHYYQEAGRAGRDEKKAYAVMLYAEKELTTIIKQASASSLPVARLKALYQLLANYYQVAVGSHEGVTYDFDVLHFAGVYDLAIKQVKAGLRQLASAGLIQLNEQFLQPARLHVTLPAKQLYAFQLANPEANRLIKKVAALYGPAVFKGFCPISPRHIAHALQIKPKALEKQLQYLHTLKVLAYHPGGKQAQLTFLTPRYAVDRLPIDAKKLLTRQKITLEKAKAVVHYLTHQYCCRAQLLLSYFGEDSPTQCATCDICIAKKNAKKGTYLLYTQYGKEVVQHLSEQPMFMNELIEKISIDDTDAVSAVVTYMLENNEVRYDANLQLVPVT